MDVNLIAYLMRYIFILLTGLAAWLFLRQSVRQLISAMRRRAVPVQGFFLLSQGSAAQDQQGHVNLRSLPLYPTTFLGHSKTCDIRLHREGIKRREAIIYLYDGIWFIRPSQTGRPVKINGVSVKTPTPLENKDHLEIAGITFSFIDDRDYTSQSKPVDLIGNDGRHPPDPLRQPIRLGKSAVNIFSLLGSILIIFLIPSQLPELRLITGISLLGLFILVNLLQLLLRLVLPGIDRILLPVCQFLLFTGLFLQIRLSLVMVSGQSLAGDLSLLTRQLLADMTPQIVGVLIGLFLLPILAVLVAKNRILEPLGLLCAVITPLLLILTLIFGSGTDSHGATLWIQIGGQSVQLTELAKITFVIVLASFFKHQPPLKTQLLFAVWAGLVFFLILLLPDLGTAMVLLPTTLLVYLVMTSAYLNTSLILMGSTAISFIAYGLFPHVQRRLSGWTTLWVEVNDNNRQIVYGLQAIARGGLLGRGLGNGSPGGIPLASSDMVFAILGEEFGLIVGLGIIMFFMVIWLTSARLALKARDGFSASLALSIGTLLFVQAFVVIAGVTGLLPLTGKTIPLLARGGSSIVSVLLLFAVLSGLSARQLEAKNK